jgi:hypothetical protein
MAKNALTTGMSEQDGSYLAQEAAFAYALFAHSFQFIPVTAVGLFFALRNEFQQQVEAVGEV